MRSIRLTMVLSLEMASSCTHVGVTVFNALVNTNFQTGSVANKDVTL